MNNRDKLEEYLCDFDVVPSPINEKILNEKKEQKNFEKNVAFFSILSFLSVVLGLTFLLLYKSEVNVLLKIFFVFSANFNQIPAIGALIIISSSILGLLLATYGLLQIYIEPKNI